VLGGDRERRCEQDGRQRLRAGGDDHDCRPSARPQRLQLVAIAEQHRKQEEHHQRVFGDDDLGCAQVLHQLVAEVGVGRPQRGRHRHEDYGIAVDARATRLAVHASH
jgi:hypothetical protein